MKFSSVIIFGPIVDPMLRREYKQAKTLNNLMKIGMSLSQFFSSTQIQQNFVVSLQPCCWHFIYKWQQQRTLVNILNVLYL